MLTVTWGIDIFENSRQNLKKTLCTLPREVGISCKVCLFCILSDHWLFDALIVGLRQICSIICQTLQEGAI